MFFKYVIIGCSGGSSSKSKELGNCSRPSYLKGEFEEQRTQVSCDASLIVIYRIPNVSAGPLKWVWSSRDGSPSDKLLIHSEP